MTEDRIASAAVQDASSDLNYAFYDHPRYEPPEAYADARDTFLDRIASVSGVVSVYESGTGEVSRPGISDVDLIVVVEDEIDDPTAVREGISAAKTDEYYFFHGPEVITRSAFPEYYNVLPMPKDLVLHYGESLEYEKNRDRFNYLAYLVDSVTTTYPMEFLELLFFPGPSIDHHRLDIVFGDAFDLAVPGVVAERFPVDLDTRFAVHRLNSLRNDMMLFADSTGRDTPVMDAFDASITDLRERWFDLDRAERETLLIERLQDAITACFAFVDHLDAYLDEIGVEVPETELTVHSHETTHNEFRPDWSVETAERDTCEYYRDGRVRTAVLPQSVTVNERLRDGDTVSAPEAYRRALQNRDRSKRQRDASMAAYKYHPMRARYMRVMGALFGLKTRLVR
ncbi:hypothetical protein [Halococcoides cellulosivorans]|uniref:Uncharacterized protein n=1 Tax=Halococcoides cellulosivorans TaxID=1679096 RepID=A0A2R4WY18_9EURY|nr:hypothetical protein [Halococcoides cellulosivorans]AWB26410.1 hypothetical protein HARCEL1_01070 [Halococcoides cellulosivorans]